MDQNNQIPQDSSITQERRKTLAKRERVRKANIEKKSSLLAELKELNAKHQEELSKCLVILYSEL